MAGTDNGIHSAVIKWLRQITKLEVIKAFPDKTPPNKPYIVCNFISSREVRDHQQNDEYEEDITGNVTAIPVIETEWHFSLHVFGAYPTNYLRPIRAAAKLAQLNEPLMPLLIIFACSKIRFVPDFVSAAWEPRAQMDLFVRGVVRDGFEIDVIEEYSIDFEQTNR